MNIDPEQWEKVPSYKDRLRDEFAMAALTGILANDTYCRELIQIQKSVGEVAYFHADGALSARDKCIAQGVEK